MAVSAAAMAPRAATRMHGGNDGKLRGVRWQGEAEVTADGGGLRLLPAAVRRGVDGIALRAVRRNAPADGVALLSVRREREHPHPGGAARGVGGVGPNRLQRVAGSEQPLREKRRAAVLRVARGKRRDGRVEAEITQVGHIPVGVAAVFFRRFGEAVHREGVAVAERLPLEHLAACGKAERQVQQLLGNAIRRLQCADVGAQLRGVRRAVYETLQRVQLSLQLVESAGGKAHRDVGHHLADDAADVRLRPGGDDLALDGEIPDGRTALHAAEKAVLRAALRQAQAGDLVSLSVEVSEEDRDRDGGAVRDASGDDAQVDVAVDAGADKATDRAADLTGHKADDKHTLARLVRPRGGGHGDAGLIRQSAAEQQNLRQNEQHEQH